MRIALVYDVAYPFVEGGGQKRMFEIAKRFVSWGWEVHWYSFKTWEGPATQLRDGITYHGLEGYAKFYNNVGVRSIRAALSFGWAVLLSKGSFSKYDVVWCGQWPYFHIIALALRRVPWRTLLLVDWWEVWGSHWITYKGAVGIIGRAIEWIIANFITRMGHAVVISEQGVAQILRLGVSRQGLTYIPNGVDIKMFSSVPRADGVSDIASFGRIKDHKNVDHIVHAIAIAKMHGKELICDVIGDGPELVRIKALANELDVANQITFHGRVNETRLIGLLKRAKVFVHPSTKEAGGSITTLEANACGLPVVCYRHPLGIDPSLIIHRSTGLMVDVFGPIGLAAGIGEMLKISEDPATRLACLSFASNFDWGIIAGRYQELFQKLLVKTKRVM